MPTPKPFRMFADPNSIDGKYWMTIVTPKRNRPKAFSVPVLVAPLTDDALTAMLRKASDTLKRRFRRGKILREVDCTISVMESLGLLKKRR
jgi:hypothetical protein